VSSVLVLTTLASTRKIERRAVLKSVVLATSVVAVNAAALWLAPRSLTALAVGAVAPIVDDHLLILTIQRLGFVMSSLAGVALVVLVRPKVSGLLQIGGSVLGGSALIVGGLSFGLGGALAGLAAVEVAEAALFMVIFLRRSARI
jgi:hypothetical protein